MALPKKRRRLVVQLAALVDLLFVVMFLQFSETQRAAVLADTSRANALKLKEQMLLDQDKLLEDRDGLQRRVEELQRKLHTAQEQAVKARTEAQAEIQEIGKAAQAVLAGMDPKQLMAQMEGASQEQRAKILAALKEARGAPGNPAQAAAHVVQTLRRSAELRKRCDVWEVHLYADGTVRVRAPDLDGASGDTPGERTFVPRDANDFTTRFMQIVTEASEPKSLVLILFTHGNAELQAIANVTKGLEQVRTLWRGQLPAQKSVQLSAPNYSEEAP
jgi:hypothetical protein